MSLAIGLTAVTVRAQRRPLVSDVTLSVDAGEAMVVAGPSGAGKSTLLRVILGLTAPDGGEVTLGGRLVSRAGEILVPPEARRLAAVLQDLALWPHLTVEQNLGFALEARGVPRDERRARTNAMLERVDLASKGTRRPGELSGGEQQRVAIGRALVSEPDAVVLDEPLASLDVLGRRELLVLFRALLHERGVTSIYVTHDPREAAELGGRVAVLEAGRLVQLGTAAELRAAPASPFVAAFAAELAERA